MILRLVLATTVAFLMTPTTALLAIYGGGWPNDTAYVEASKTPNATRAVPFYPFYVDGVHNNGRNTPDETNEWAWRVNVSSLSPPQNSSARPLRTDKEHHRLTQSVYTFSWPQGGTLGDALNQTDVNMTATALIGTLRSNVTNRYDASHGADCAPVLGSECAETLRLARDGGFLGASECADTFGTYGVDDSREEGGLQPVDITINRNESVFANETGREGERQPVANGVEGRYVWLDLVTEPYEAGEEERVFERESTKLHVVRVEMTPVGGGLVRQELLCMRIDDKQLDESGNGGSGSSGDKEDGGDGQSAAVKMGEKSVGALVVAAGVFAFGLLQ